MADAVTALRAMVAADVPAAQLLTASFGWPHRREDLTFMLSLGDGVIAEREGEVAGTAVCWRFGADWGTMGMIGVAEALHGRGIGRRMMEALLRRLEGRSLALHATRAGLKLYRSMGFEATGTVVQHQGAAAQPGLQALPRGARLRPLSRADLPEMAALDRAATGMDRAGLLGALLGSPGGIALDQDGAVAGFSLLRRFGLGQVIGPVVATDENGALAMVAHLLGQRAGQFMRMDVPKNGGLGPWLAGLGLEEAGTVIRMVRGPDVAVPGGVRTFGLASQAFG